MDVIIVAIADGGNLSSQRKHREFAIRKFHAITETFLSLVGTDTNQDVDLLVQVTKSNIIQCGILVVFAVTVRFTYSETYGKHDRLVWN